MTTEAEDACLWCLRDVFYAVRRMASDARTKRLSSAEGDDSVVQEGVLINVLMLMQTRARLH